MGEPSGHVLNVQAGSAEVRKVFLCDRTARRGEQVDRISNDGQGPLESCGHANLPRDSWTLPSEPPRALTGEETPETDGVTKGDLGSSLALHATLAQLRQTTPPVSKPPTSELRASLLRTSAPTLGDASASVD